MLDPSKEYELQVVWSGAHGEGGYNASAEISLAVGKCTVCDEKRLCLEMDGSNEEYFNGRICEECATKAWRNHGG